MTLGKSCDNVRWQYGYSKGLEVKYAGGQKAVVETRHGVVVPLRYEITDEVAGQPRVIGEAGMRWRLQLDVCAVTRPTGHILRT